MTIQRYSLYHQAYAKSQLVEDPEGDLVKYEDYEKSEQRYQALLDRIYCGECGHQYDEDGECECDE